MAKEKMPSPMTPARSVYLIPTDDDRYGLLREGPCGFRPPTADLWRCPTCGLSGWEHGSVCNTCDACRANGEQVWLIPANLPTGTRALVLKWDGEVQLPGCWIVASTLAWRHGNHLHRVYVAEDFQALLDAVLASDLGILVEIP